jgi:hypothetical protein
MRFFRHMAQALVLGGIFERWMWMSWGGASQFEEMVRVRWKRTEINALGLMEYRY